MNYQKVWGVMNDFEESFNRITTLEWMISELQDAVDKEDLNQVNELTSAMTSYIGVYTDQYDRASKRAWNNTVGEVAKEENPYRVYDYSSVSYDDVLNYEEDTMIDLYNSKDDSTTKEENL